MEREQVDRIFTAKLCVSMAKLIGAFAVAGMILCLVVTIAATALAWTFGWFASSLAADTRFLMATMVVCTAVVCLVLTFIAANIRDELQFVSLLAHSMQEADDEADDEDETEFESDEVARQVGRHLMRNAFVDDVLARSKDSIDLPVKRQRHQPIATKARKRRSTK